MSSLAYIGSASAKMRAETQGSDPRRFRLGDEKEGAGVADAVIYLELWVLNKVSGPEQVG